MERRPLPAALGTHFSVAQAMGAGIHPKRLDAGDLTAPFRGMRVTQEPTTYADLAEAALVVMPGGALFSHTTAARLMGVPLPIALESSAGLHVTVPRKAARWRHEGFVEHHADRAGTTWSGLPLVAVADTWVDLASILSASDLVVAGDFLLRAQLCSSDDLHAAVAGRRGARGLRRTSDALPLLRHSSASPMETRARLAFARWKLPEPELNVDILDARGGWIGRVDFLWRAAWVIGEYYGGVHAASWTSDLKRAAQLEDAGYRVVVMTSRDLGPGAADLRARLQRLLRN
ncbi:hypothetical protein V3G39_15315 [Dermatophilaceae bacterium Sec6.4]